MSTAAAQTLELSIEQLYSWTPGQSVYCRVRAHTSLFFDQRMKLSFASEPVYICFLWLEILFLLILILVIHGQDESFPSVTP